MSNDFFYSILTSGFTCDEFGI